MKKLLILCILLNFSTELLAFQIPASCSEEYYMPTGPATAVLYLDCYDDVTNCSAYVYLGDSIPGAGVSGAYYSGACTLTSQHTHCSDGGGGYVNYNVTHTENCGLLFNYTYTNNFYTWFPRECWHC